MALLHLLRNQLPVRQSVSLFYLPNIGFGMLAAEKKMVGQQTQTAMNLYNKDEMGRVYLLRQQ